MWRETLAREAGAHCLADIDRPRPTLPLHRGDVAAYRVRQACHRLFHPSPEFLEAFLIDALISRGWHLEWAVDLEQHPVPPPSTWIIDLDDTPSRGFAASARPVCHPSGSAGEVSSVQRRRRGARVDTPARRNPAFELSMTSTMRNTASLQTRPEAAVPGAARNDETARSRRLPSKWRTMQKIALPAMASRAQRQVLLIGIQTKSACTTDVTP